MRKSGFSGQKIYRGATGNCHTVKYNTLKMQRKTWSTNEPSKGKSNNNNSRVKASLRGKTTWQVYWILHNRTNNSNHVSRQSPSMSNIDREWGKLQRKGKKKLNLRLWDHLQLRSLRNNTKDRCSINYSKKIYWNKVYHRQPRSRSYKRSRAQCRTQKCSLNRSWGRSHPSGQRPLSAWWNRQTLGHPCCYKTRISRQRSRCLGMDGESSRRFSNSGQIVKDTTRCRRVNLSLELVVSPHPLCLLEAYYLVAAAVQRKVVSSIKRTISSKYKN